MMIADGGERGDCLTLLPVVSSKIYKISNEKEARGEGEKRVKWTFSLLLLPTLSSCVH